MGCLESLAWKSVESNVDALQGLGRTTALKKRSILCFRKYFSRRTRPQHLRFTQNEISFRPPLFPPDLSYFTHFASLLNPSLHRERFIFLVSLRFILGIVIHVAVTFRCGALVRVHTFSYPSEREML